MLATYTIRNKMLIWLVLLVAMAVSLAATAITGLRSYRRTVEYLELSIKAAPRSADLATAISLLIQPCAIDVPIEAGPQRDAAARVQQREFLAALEKSKLRVADFRRRLDDLPRATERSELESSTHRALFAHLDGQFQHLAAAGRRLAEPDHDAHLKFILTVAAELLDSINSIPDPAGKLAERLRLAQADYEWRLRFVWGTAVTAAGLFAWLVGCGYWWVFRPLSRLHQGALRVADDGDFTFRVETETDDELSELANAFNKMTGRFQQVRADLDQQVQQRCRQLVQSERLAGVGFLSAGVAHEINNPLAAIVGAADSLEWRLSEHLDKFPAADVPIIREYLQMMQTEAERCRKITEKMLDFARGSDSERNLYDVTAIVREVVGMTQHLGRFRDRAIVVERTSPCYAWVNGPEIKQVVLNLVANALEATPAGGRVTIDIRDCSAGAEVTITDNGVGMSPDVLQHIFEPFFTKREAGKGTGLGLSISHRIVQDHGGSLEATSPGPGQGSTFRLRLPSEAPAANRAA